MFPVPSNLRNRFTSVSYLQVTLQPLCKLKIQKINMRYADSAELRVKTEIQCVS